MNKIDAKTLGEPQLETVLKYAIYIEYIARARANTFQTDNLQIPGEYWYEIKLLAETIKNQISPILEKETLGL